jgi:mRNA interferase HigB
MHVITRKRLKEAATAYRDTATPLDGWFRVTKKAKWESLADVRKVWASADIFGTCTIFNIKGNKYRLIVWIDYRSKRVFIRRVLTHADYSKEGWKSDCISN